jgi:hypothetical protein
LLPHLEPHAVTLAKHLGGAADIPKGDVKVTPHVAQIEFLETVFVALVALFHGGPCAFLVREGVLGIYEVELIYASVAVSADR